MHERMQGKGVSFYFDVYFVFTFFDSNSDLSGFFFIIFLFNFFFLQFV